ncbi:psbP domain-containing protein 2, chloroplastic-like [Syzygium oleosum]|uniref:psbP domain-containing protein 2, chloroplastic-like n=1 Tax=Syzygium oleosum TaxID=219896 RepID=UPI0024B9028B|nr:psbP domain-containing protein 2, chloroplastic-like [Syzygium oleosum]
MALQTCSALSDHHRSLFNLRPFPFPPLNSSTSRSITKPRIPTRNRSPRAQVPFLPAVRLSKRRAASLSILAILLNGCGSSASLATLPQEVELERYTDSKEGFTLLKPSSWVKVDKAGATVLFEEPTKGSNNVGVVVSPVRLASLDEFGSPQFVADKLIQAEKRKESTKDAEVIGVAERSGRGGLQVYEFEYKLDSSRGGMKRIFSAAFVTSKKLYLLNIAHSDKPESPLDTQTRMMLEEVLHSFDAVPGI